MNRRCWRVIFSRVKAMLIVVSDIARTGRAAVAGRTLKHPRPPLFTDGVPAGLSLPVLTFSVMLACGLVSAPATARSVIHRDTAAPGHQQPDIMSTANGLPQVNIQTPSAGGVSLNKYTQFDVDNRGVILNNARKPVQTQLGGWVTGNPYLVRGEAKVIVNEVNARQPSQLNGYVEVAGKRARVVIASPAGITCNGCGFINANKATLTTGQVRMQNDRIAGYDVSRGTVTVQGKGMDVRDASTTEIFARAVKLNAEIQAGELTVVTGQNTIVNREGQGVSADAVTVNTDDGSAKPVFALDSSALGGMYANKITFIGTEKGVGVNMEGDTASMPGDIILTADGTVRNKGSLAASGTVNITSVQGDVINQGRLEAQQTLSLSAGGQLLNTASGYVTTERDIQADAARGVENHGRLYAAGNARIHTAGAVIHNGSLMTGGDLSLTAASLDAGHDSLLAAGADRHGNKTGAHNLTLTTTGPLVNRGNLSVTGQAALKGGVVSLDNATAVADNLLLNATTGALSITGSRLQADDTLALISPSAVAGDNARLRAQRLRVSTPVLSAADGVLVQTGPDYLQLNISQEINISGGTLATRGHNLTLATPVLKADGGTLTHTGNGRFLLDAGMFSGAGVTLHSNGGLVLNSHAAGLNDATLTAESLSVHADSLDIRHGTLYQTGRGIMNVRADGHLDYSDGSLLSAGGLSLQTDTLTGTEGRLAAITDADISTHSLMNPRGKIQAGNTLTLSATGLDNTDGLVTSGQDMVLSDSRSVNNIRGTIAAGGTLQFLSTGLDNSAGLLQSGHDMLLDTHGGTLINRDSGTSGIISLGNLTLRAGTLDNTDGWLSSNGWTNATTGDMDNSRGTFGAQQNLTLSALNLTSVTGLIHSDTGLTLTTGALINTRSGDSGGIISQGSLSINSRYLDNTAGLIRSAQDMTVDTGTNALINQDSGEHGGIISGGRLSLVTGELSNRNGLLTGQSDTTVASGPTDNRGGMLASNTGSLTLNSGELDNSTGRIQAGTDLQLDAHGQRVINTDTTGLGGILSQGTLTLKGGLLNNACGTIAATGTAGISIRDADNTDGRILSGGALSLLSDTVNNLRGLLQSAGMLTLDTRHHALINTDSGSRGGIIAAGDVRLDTGRIEGDRGVLTGQNVIINTGNDAFSHQGSRTDVAGNLHLETGQLDNRGGLIRTGGNLEADTHGQALINTNSGTDGGLFSNGRLTLSTGILDNQDGTLLSRQNADITAGRTDNHNGTLASLNGTLTLNAGETQNAGGLIQSAGALWLDTQNAGLDNSDHGAIRSGSGLTLRSGGLNNPDGVIAGQACVTVSTGNLTNTGGSITGGQDMTLTTLSLTSPGGLIRADGALSINTQGRPLVNTGSGASGGLVSLSSLTMTTGVLDNQTGFIASGGAVSLTAGTVSNQNGLLAGNGGLTVNSLAFDNAYGTLRSSADLSAVTQGQTFTNTHGVVSGGADTRIISGALDNTSGRIQGITGLALDTGNAPLSNTQGTLISAGVLSLLSDVMDNTNGQLQSAGNATLNLTQRLDNTAGLLRGGQTLNITAPVIINHDTRGEDKGAEAQTILIQTADMDNTQGALRAAIQLDADLHATLNNTGGLISSEGGLNIHDGDASPASAINNDNGIMTAGTQGQVRAASLQGKGQVLSQGNLSLSLSDTLDNTGRLAADGDLQIDDAQDVSNSGDISAGQTLTLWAQNIRNQADGNISALNTDLTARGTFDNTGLVDGGLTRIIAATLNNTGTGRLYGDHVALQAGTLSNQKTAGDAPVIAARERLDVGADTVTNTDHALLYSGGDMAFGGQLNSQNLATGAGRQLDNHSAQIDADGDLSLHMQTVDNRDIHLALSPQPVEVSREHHHEFQLDGGSPRYDAGDPRITAKTGGREHRLTTPEGGSKDFNEYYYDRVTAETQVIHQDPAEILAGGALRWQGVTLTNQDSRVIAGGDLTTTGVVNNQESEGVRRVTDTDQGTPWAGQGDRRHKRPGKRHGPGGKKSSKVKTSPYGPYVTTTTLPLHLMRYEGNTAPTENVPALPGRQPAVVIPAVSSAGTPVTAAQRPANIPLSPAVQSLRSLSLPAPPARTSADGHIRDVLAGLKPAPALSAVPPGAAFSDLSPSLRARPLALPPGQHFTLTLPPADGHDATEVRMAVPDIRLPDSRLFDIHPGNQTGWLVETDPRFTQKKRWLGTDYMQQALSTSPDRLMKRLGDGWYEQKLVREQVIALTGQRYLYGYGDDETQLRALMNNGIAFAHEYHLTPGIALSPEQMALLTSDMVWLVNDTVTLPDGTRQTVQVPQLYVRARPGDLSGNGALLAGRSVTISSPGHVTNSGLISGRDVTRITSQSLTNSGSLLGPKIDLQARESINNTGGRIIAGSALALLAGHDISSTTTLRTDGTDTGADRTAGIYVQQPGGSLTLQALGNITLTASRLENTGSGSTTRLFAGQDIRFDTLTTSRTENHDWGKHEYLHQFWQSDLASHLTTQGDLTLTAGQDIHATAADVSAGGTLSARAGRDIRLDTGTATRDITENSRQTSGGVLSKSRVETHDEVHDRQAVSTTFSGDTVSLLAGNNISIYGSNIAGTRDVGLLAGNDLNITTTMESHQESHLKKEKKSGLMSSGGIGFTVGSSSQKSTTEGQGDTQLGSTVGSQRGDLTLSAGRNATLHGSDLVAGGNLSVTGQNVSITAAENTQTTLQKFERHQSGLTVALSGAVGSALNTAVQNVQQSRQPQDARLQALGGVKAALSGIQAAQALELNNAQQAAQQAGSGEEAPAAFGVTASIGSQSSASEQKTESHTVSGSSLNAGHDIRISATGDGQGHGGDILIQGSQAKAAHDIELDAQRDIQLLSALNTETLSGKNSSHGGSVGVGINVGQNTGITVSAGVNAAKGHENGTTLIHTNTNLDAGHHVTLNAGRDATLKGAQVSGEKITADVKRNLTLQSGQDSDHYDSKQQSAGAGASYTWGAGGPSASVSLSQDKINSNFDSVKEQTGLFAGKEGFDVTTGQHTQLDGAVIASTADKTKNRLDTGTLGFSDIHNQADFSAQHQGITAGTGGSTGSQLLTNMATDTLSGVNTSGHDSSTTHAAVSDGSLIVRNTADQTQDISALSRDTDHAANGLSPVFDKEKVQRQLQQAQMVSDISSQILDIYNTHEAVSATRKVTKEMQEASARENARTQAEKELTAEQKKNPSLKIDEERITQRAWQNLYNQALKASDARVGDPVRQAVTASVAVLSGLAGGDIKAALANGAAPYLATGLKRVTGGDTPSDEQMAVRLMGHAIIGGVVAELNGAPASGGAAGAVTGEAAAMTISGLYFGKPPSELSESEREQLSGMSTVAAALAGSLASASSSGTVAGARAGKNAVENNFLSGDLYALDRKVKAAKEKGEDIEPILEDARKQSQKDREKMEASCKANPDTCGFSRDAANDAQNEILENGPFLNIDPDVAKLVAQETAKDNAVISQNTSEFGKGLVAASEGLSIIAGMGTSAALNVLKTGGAIRDPKTGSTVTVYRVEGVPNTRVLIGEKGQVTITGETTLYLNFGDKARAQEFLQKRISQNMEGATVKTFEVPKSVLDDLRKNAVSESEVKLYPNRPIIADPTKAPDQYGIRPDKIKDLQDKIIQGTGKDASK
ncbi:filamentous hemagglutinin N-terminal domain-containing protein [Salmonella enterica]|nr:filamentous hemagglutinin N-terminal domain-containing protein [Salmonella enterica]